MDVRARGIANNSIRVKTEFATSLLPLEGLGALPSEVLKKSDEAQREKEVGRRLVAARRKLALTQTDFAVRAGIGRERLASYEEARVPLPWRIGDKICETFDINACWLANGIEPSEFYLKPDGNLDSLPARTRFTAVFDQYFRPYYEQLQNDPDLGSLPVALRSADEMARLRKTAGPRYSEFKRILTKLDSLFHEIRSNENRWAFVQSLLNVATWAVLRQARQAREAHQKQKSPP